MSKGVSWSGLVVIGEVGYRLFELPPRALELFKTPSRPFPVTTVSQEVQARDALQIKLN